MEPSLEFADGTSSRMEKAFAAARLGGDALKSWLDGDPARASLPVRNGGSDIFDVCCMMGRPDDALLIVKARPGWARKRQRSGHQSRSVALHWAAKKCPLASIPSLAAAFPWQLACADEEGDSPSMAAARAGRWDACLALADLAADQRHATPLAESFALLFCSVPGGLKAMEIDPPEGFGVELQRAALSNLSKSMDSSEAGKELLGKISKKSWLLSAEDYAQCARSCSGNGRSEAALAFASEGIALFGGKGPFAKSRLRSLFRCERLSSPQRSQMEEAAFALFAAWEAQAIGGVAMRSSTMAPGSRSQSRL